VAIGTSSFSPFLILEKNRFTDNYVRMDTVNWTWGAGGGADLWGASARVVGNLFEGNNVVGIVGAKAGGMGIYPYTQGPLPEAYIQGNIFRENYLHGTRQGTAGAGLEVVETKEVTIRENLFESNMAISMGTSGLQWGRAVGGGLCISDGSTTGYGQKLVVGNRFINNYVRSYNGEAEGGGLYLYLTQATISGNAIIGNTARGTFSYGGGINTHSTSFRLENNIITQNNSYSYGGGIFIDDYNNLGVEGVIVNNTIFDNEAASYGGGLAIITGATVVALNNIFWADNAPVGKEIYVDQSIGFIRYNDIQGGYAGVGNIDADPQFVFPRLDSLNMNSPCINAGVDSALVTGLWYYTPETDYHGHPRPQPVGSMPDIGAEESPYPDALFERPQGVPKEFALYQNYPNPFNPTSSIKFDLPRTSQVSIKIYNILGEEVTSLVSGRLVAGSYVYEWDASGIASGVYLYRIEANTPLPGFSQGFIQSRKMVLMK
jgi:hypothetical protein